MKRLALLLVFLLAACNPHKTTLPSDVSEWGDDDDITLAVTRLDPEERQLFIAYTARRVAAANGAPPPADGSGSLLNAQTVGDAIIEQRVWRDRDAVRQEKWRRQMAQAQAEAQRLQARREQMRLLAMAQPAPPPMVSRADALAATANARRAGIERITAATARLMTSSLRVSPGPYQSGKELHVFTLEFTNLTDKEIRYVEGDVELRDGKSDARFASYHFRDREPIPPHRTVTFSQTLDFNSPIQLTPPVPFLINDHLKGQDFKAVLLPGTIRFADNTQLTRTDLNGGLPLAGL